MKTILISICIVLLVGCTSHSTKNNNTSIPIQQISAKKTLPDTINLLGGFRVGMTEKEIRDYVKNHRNKFFIDYNALLAVLRTKFDNVTYMVTFDLYRGKLQKITYMVQKGWSSITDPKMKDHYNNIYMLLKKANVYANIKNVYKDEFNADWPYSFGSKTIVLAKFCVTGDIGDNDFIVYLDQDPDDYNYFFSIVYTGESELNYESTLHQQLYFEELK